MNIRLSNKEDMNSVRKIWEYCFRGDSKEYVDFYFSKKYKNLNTLVAEMDGEVVSSIHLNKHSIKLFGVDLPTQYVVGVSTLPESRGAGIMGNMMKEALYEMKNRGNSFSILMPIDFRLYRKFGYENCYDVLEHSFDIFQLRGMKLVGNFSKAKKSNVDDMVYLYGEYTKNLNGFALRDRMYFEDFIDEMDAEGGYIYINYIDGKPIGYISYYLMEDTIMVREAVYSDIKSYSSILKFIFNHNTQVKNVVIATPVVDYLVDLLPNPRSLDSKKKSFMMARILDFEKFIKDINVTGAKINGFEEINIKVLDDVISENEGIYRILNEDGRLVINKLPNSTKKIDIELSVRDLSQVMMGYRKIEEILFKKGLDVGVASKFNKVFPDLKRDNFILEYV